MAYNKALVIEEAIDFDTPLVSQMALDDLRKQAKKEFLHELSRHLHKYTVSLILDDTFAALGHLWRSTA